jgi:hypothetical protein
LRGLLMRRGLLRGLPGLCGVPRLVGRRSVRGHIGVACRVRARELLALTAGLGGGLVLAFRNCGPGHMLVEQAGEAWGASAARRTV